MKRQFDPTEHSAQGLSGQSYTASRTRDDADFPRRNTELDWDAMISDYAVIERRAQAMRSEAAWSIAQALRGWVVKVFSQGKAKAGAGATTPLERHGQPV